MKYFMILSAIAVVFATYLLILNIAISGAREGFEDSCGNVVDTIQLNPTAPELKSEQTSESSAPDISRPATEGFNDEKPAEEGEFHIDIGSSFIEAYKKLNPQQLTSMTKDTKELIETQKQLMATLTTLKPLITDGREMLKTFSDYFGTMPTATSL